MRRGTSQVSLLNFVRYNVAGGGDSALYGVESGSYYLRNGANQLNAVLPLALAGFPLLLLLGRLSGVLQRPQPRLLLALSPVYVWLAALSLLPHKEERFLYVVYPLVRSRVVSSPESAPGSMGWPRFSRGSLGFGPGSVVCAPGFSPG